MLDEPVSAILEGTGMAIRCAPAPLDKYLGCFWALAAAPSASVRTLPDGCAQLLVEFADGFPPQCLISGPRLGPSVYEPPPMTDVVGVRLRPGVAYALWRKPVCELVNRREPFPAPELGQQMAGALSRDARFDALESFLSRKLACVSLDTRVVAAVELIRESSGHARIDEVARRCCVGRRHLERLMLRWVGLSPKRLARIARFQSLLGGVADGPPPDWTSLAPASYADQSHLIREFAEFAGKSPRRFLADRPADSSVARCG